VGDALGVPVEGKSRERLILKPIKDMVGFGSFNLPPGSWSDDSSMTLCLTESLVNGYDLDMIAANFLSWMYTAHWTPHGKAFGTGRAITSSLQFLQKDFSPKTSGNSDEASNGNGSLMRTIPLLWHIFNMDLDSRYEIVKAVSSITHSHIRSVLACFYYLEYAKQLTTGISPIKALRFTINIFRTKTSQLGICEEELKHFSRLLTQDFDNIPVENIHSSGYVIDTLEASIWCLLNTGTFKEAVLRAVNLGGDSDTTAAVTGGLAGIVYDVRSIPTYWLSQVAKIEDIQSLVYKFSKKYF